MSANTDSVIREITGKYGDDRFRMMDIVRDVQRELGHIPEDAIQAIAKKLGVRRVEVLDTVSFYHFLSTKPMGKTVIRLCDAEIERMNGMEEVAAALEKETGTVFGGTTADGSIGLKYTSCIGMSDQPCSALINGQVATNLKPADIPDLIKAVKEGAYDHPEQTFTRQPTGQVENNLKRTGSVIFSPMENGAAIRKALSLEPEEVIGELNVARVRGRGGAGFPTAMKWDFCRKAQGDAHYVICNADEGEPGTFKDRVILTEAPDLLFEGMTIAGYSIGAELGLLYLRAEYQYLFGYLQDVLSRRRKSGLLGENICGKEGFNFDIRIQLGAGAYICGEESGLIESLEGRRGAPRDRPPFPVTDGYLHQPSAVNNVETLCCTARILEKGGEWFSKIGTRDSTGTKLFSVSGDCERPGVYELEFGITIDDLLEITGAEEAQAVQVGGPSGQCVAPKDFGRSLSFEDMPTGGSIMIFGPDRDIISVVRQFTRFFCMESCGWCAPCRVGTSLIGKKLDKIIEGKGTQTDLEELKTLGEHVTILSRCGLGQTAAKPVLTSMSSFPDLYQALIKEGDFIPSFDIERAVALSEGITGRESLLKEELKNA